METGGEKKMSDKESLFCERGRESIAVSICN